jgi:thiol:disulfide interchange protein DsbA
MDLTRRAFNRSLLAGLAGAVLPIYSRVVKAAPLVEGRDYELILPPQPGESPGMIEVIEFFPTAVPIARTSTRWSWRGRRSCRGT